ncbi:DUF5684 domain-containing protein [Clostridium akagii]|uniref:DUF5684 domain-containing protein n=1 Tax=Clostridium akagii TaxID=91623 RepID=UPI00047DA591|nr:DUF5684 domain-containing protein [Clostridium akagii]
MLNVLFHLLSLKSVIMIFLINYILWAITWCKLSIKSNMKNQWMAFIPFFQFVLFLHMIDRSGWYVFFLFVPLINIILVEVWFSEFYNSFNVGVLWIVLSIIIYPISYAFMIYMSYSPKIKYIGCSSFVE